VFLRNVTLTGGVAPARASIDQLLPDILDGIVQPGKVFDRTVDLQGVPTATAPWPTARRSRCWSAHERVDNRRADADRRGRGAGHRHPPRGRDVAQAQDRVGRPPRRRASTSDP
jgi:hypothetical protein